MKKLNELTSDDLAKWAERQGLTSVPTQEKKDEWEADRPLAKRIEDRINWKRLEEDGAYFDEIRKDGRYESAVRARAERLATEAETERRAEARKRLEEIADEREAANRAEDARAEQARQDRLVADENDYRRRSGRPLIRGYGADGKPIF